MDHIISDSSITSCQEMEEAAVEALSQRMRDIVRHAYEEDDTIVREKNALQEELDDQLRTIMPFQERLTNLQDWASDQLMIMLETQTKLTQVNVDTVNLLSSLQEQREQNQATLQADPVFALMQEERELRKQLEDTGIIIVEPPSDSEEFSE